MKTLLAFVSLLCLALIPLMPSLLLQVLCVTIAVAALMVAISQYRTNLLPFLLLLAAVPIVPFVKWFEPTFIRQATESVVQSINIELDIAESSISQFFQNNELALSSVEVLVTQEPDVDDATYQRWMQQVLPPQRNRFLNVALTSNLVVTHVYPKNESNLRVLGVDLAQVPGQGLSYRNALSTQQPIVIGPVQLLQGMPGIIYVRPVFGTESVMVSGVLSLQFLADELSFLLSDSVDLDVTISTVSNDYRLMSHEFDANTRQVERLLRHGEVSIALTASSPQLESVARQTKTITRLSAGAFWLVLSVILGWQHLNYRTHERQRYALKESEKELINAQRVGQIGSWSSPDQKNFYLSLPLQELIQYPKDQLQLDDYLTLVHPSVARTHARQMREFFQSEQSNLVLEHMLKTGDEFRWYEHRIVKHPSNALTGILRDIHSLKMRDEQVAKLESFDSLTGAANRHYFKQLTIQNIALCDRRNTNIGLVLVNLDDFRSINEKYGQHSGDELLKQVAHRLTSASRKSDAVARLSGDTFAITLVDIGRNKQSVPVIEQILRRMKEPYALSENIYPQLTMGVSLFPEDANDYDSLLRMAESALSSAKEESRGHYRFYSAELSKQTDRRQKVLASLPGAIANNHLSLVFQPRVDSARTSDTPSMEALVRWHDPVLGHVSPGEFVPIAEQSSLIGDIGNWVMAKAFELVAAHQAKLPNGVSVSINLSPRQLEDANLVGNVKNLLAKYHVDASQFELEITEHSISEESDAVMKNMHALSVLGFQFAMDDFGTGYSNLGILQSLPLNVLKVDMSFIRAIGTSEKSDELVKAIVNLGHTLGLRVVAEGVESVAQVQFLRELHCEELQGFYFFKPQPIDELLPYLTIHDE